jgi:hypothetical protein
MSLIATVVDPLREPAPAGWDRFVVTHQLLPAWEPSLLRAADWSAQPASSMVAVHEPQGADPVAIFHARHLGPVNPARFATPGRVPRVCLTECRTAPVPMEAGMAFAAGTGPADRTEAVRAFERALGRRTGPGGRAIAYRNLQDWQLAVVPTAGRLRIQLSPRMVLRNEWPDLASYLASLPGKWRSQLKRIHETVSTDPAVRVGWSDPVDPAQACWLAEVVRRRHASRLVPRPPLPAGYFERLGRLPGTRFLAYRDERGVAGFSAAYDNGTDLLLIWWGSREATDGRRRNLYFDQYYRLIELMIATGRRRLILGSGMERLKRRYGAQAEQRWGVVGVR